MILAWASPFNSAGRALSSKILWPTKINLLRPLIQQAGPYLQKSYGPLKLTCCVKNKDIAQSVAQR